MTLIIIKGAAVLALFVWLLVELIREFKAEIGGDDE